MASPFFRPGYHFRRHARKGAAAAGDQRAPAVAQHLEDLPTDHKPLRKLVTGVSKQRIQLGLSNIPMTDPYVCHDHVVTFTINIPQFCYHIYHTYGSYGRVLLLSKLGSAGVTTDHNW